MIERKNRSDDKGPEPEAITVAEIDGKLYAIIGLERVGGFFVYDVTDPYNAEYVTYFFNRNFDLEPEEDITGDIAPEDVIVISSEDSPNGNTLIVTAAEVSGTISLFQIGDGVAPLVQLPNTVVDAEEAKTGLAVFPNPVVENVTITMDIAVEGQARLSVYDQMVVL